MSKRKRAALQKAAKKHQTDRRFHSDFVEVERAAARHERQFHSRVKVREPFYLRHLGLIDQCKGDHHEQANTDHPPVIRTRRAP